MIIMTWAKLSEFIDDMKTFNNNLKTKDIAIYVEKDIRFIAYDLIDHFRDNLDILINTLNESNMKSRADLINYTTEFVGIDHNVFWNVIQDKDKLTKLLKIGE